MNIKLGKYRHYKGNEYEVLGLARHSETEEYLVIYKTCYGDNSTWVRPYEMFTENVTIDGKTQPRFAYIEKQTKQKHKSAFPLADKDKKDDLLDALNNSLS